MNNGIRLEKNSSPTIDNISDPGGTNRLFTGGVKPEDDSNPTALHKKDFDLLISKYPNDYRAYMFRGLFYASFTTYGEEFYTPALNDLKQAKEMNVNSALVSYFIGTVYQKSSFWTKAAWADNSESGGYRDKVNSVALQHFKDAAKLDPQFAEAYAQAAQSLLSLKRYQESLPFYDKVIELEPENASAWNDRGLAKKNLDDYYGAISDFTKAIELIKAKPGTSSYLDINYENRAASYAKVTNYDSAIADYSRAIGLKFASRVFLMSLPQIRAIYPELRDIPDRDLLEGFRQKYMSNISQTDFYGHYEKNTKPLEDFVLAELYGARGDAYLKAGNFRKAAIEYARALHAWGKWVADDRWKVISKTSEAEYAVDTQTLDFSQGNIVSLWVKVLNRKTRNYSHYQFDCSGRKVKSVSASHYNSRGNVLYTHPAQDWQGIIPDSIGESLYSGMCK